MKQFTLLFIFSIGILVTSCGGNDCDLDKAAAAAENISTTANEYYLDITKKDNCIAYKAAIDDYIGIASDCEDLADVITFWQNEKKDLDCN